MERDGEAESNNANPYWSAREKLVKPLRQEAFSFAASTIVSLTKTHSSHDFPTVWNVQSLHVNGLNPKYVQVVQCEWD